MSRMSFGMLVADGAGRRWLVDARGTDTGAEWRRQPPPGTTRRRRPPGSRAIPADSLYQAAREALNQRDYRRAADLFAEVPGQLPRSGYAADAYYWRAFRALPARQDGAAQGGAAGRSRPAPALSQGGHPGRRRGAPIGSRASSPDGATSPPGDVDPCAGGSAERRRHRRRRRVGPRHRRHRAAHAADTPVMRSGDATTTRTTPGSPRSTLLQQMDDAAGPTDPAEGARTARCRRRCASGGRR